MFDILVMSEAQARYAFHNKPYAIIGFTDTDRIFPEYYESENLVDTLVLSVDDITEPEENRVLFSYIHALQILAFVERHKNDIDLLIVHCVAGISRSPAVAAALSKIYGINNYHTYFTLYRPNEHVFNVLMRVYNAYRRNIQGGKIRFPGKPLKYSDEELKSEAENFGYLIHSDEGN